MSATAVARFQCCLSAIRKDEIDRAEFLKGLTKDLTINHLLCVHGYQLKERLLESLLVCSPLSFRTLMTKFFCDSKSQSMCAIIYNTATLKQVHPSTILLEYLPKTMKIADFIANLESANLFRVIACFEPELVRALTEHVKSECACSATKSNDVMSPSITETNKNNCTTRRPSKPPKEVYSRGIVLLSFTEDGKNHAAQVKRVLESQSFSVRTLGNFSSLISENPHFNIRWLISKVDFVVPILTDSYFQLIDKSMPPTSSGFDEKYAPLLIELLLLEWGTEFINKRVRCYKPREVSYNLKIPFGPFTAVCNDIDYLRLYLRKAKHSK